MSWTFVTDYGNFSLSREEVLTINSILDGNKRTKINRLERVLLWDFVGLYAKDELENG